MLSLIILKSLLFSNIVMFPGMQKQPVLGNKYSHFAKEVSQLPKTCSWHGRQNACMDTFKVHNPLQRI